MISSDRSVAETRKVNGYNFNNKGIGIDLTEYWSRRRAAVKPMLYLALFWIEAQSDFGSLCKAPPRSGTL